MGKISKYLFPILLGVVTTMLSLSKVGQYIASISIFNSSVLNMLLLVLSFLIIFKRRIQISKIHSISIWAWVYFLIAVIGAFYGQHSWSDYLNTFCILVYVPLAFSVGRRLYDISKYNIKRDVVTIFLILPAYVCSFIFLSKYRDSLTIIDRDFVFPIIIIASLALFFQSKLLKFSSLLLFASVSFFSTKRTAILSIIVLLVFAILQEMKEFARQRNRIFSFLVIVATVFVGYKILYADQTQTEHIISRFRDDDTGSGRVEIYNNLFRSIQKKNVSSLIIGGGYRSLERVIGMPAHNDLLQIAFDFGLLAAIIYLVFILKNIRAAFFYRNNFYIAIILNFLIIGMLNATINTPIYVFLNFFVLGYTLESSSYNTNYSINGNG